MERFVRLIVAGGLVLVGACWLVAFADYGSVAWVSGVGLALLGTGAVFGGILGELEPGAFAIEEV